MTDGPEDGGVIFGVGEEAGGVSVPNPLGIISQKYNFDFYCAMAAAGLFALTDMAQYPNSDDIAEKIAKRAEIFGNIIKKRFPEAFS